MLTNRFDIERLLSNVDLTTLAEQAGAQFHTSGKNQRSVCPLHKGDNKNAFTVYTGDDGLQRWHCFTGCHTGGDAIDFVRSWKGYEFRESVAFLAVMAHVELKSLNISDEEIQSQTVLRQKYSLLNTARQYFEEHLASKKGDLARNYLLQERKFTAETIQSANMGFSSSDIGLRDYLKDQHADTKLAEEIGLLRSDGRDFTANGNGQTASPDGYITFAHTVNGNTLYFSARACTPVSKMPDSKDKSRNMPGTRQSYWAIVPGDPDIFIVEGQSDAESLRQIGKSAMALCGVGHNLPENDLTRLKKRRKIYLAIDNDSLEIELTDDEREQRREKVATLQDVFCAAVGPLTLVVPDLPYKDFNAWLQVDLSRANLTSHIKKSRPWIDLLLESGENALPQDKDLLSKKLLPMLQSLPKALYSNYRHKVASLLGMKKSEFDRFSVEINDVDGNPLFYIRDGCMHYKMEPISNYWTVISHELSVDDGLNPTSVRYSINGGLANGEVLHTIHVDASAFGKMGWIAENWGIRPISFLSPGKAYLLTRAIQELSAPNVLREKLYSFTGWTDADGQRGFLSATGLTHANGVNEAIRVYLGTNNMRHYALPSVVPDKVAAVRASLDFLTVGSSKVTVPIWAAVYASVLTSLRSLNAVMSVYGTTQSGKTTISMLALTHFGPGFIHGRDYRAPIDWTSTVTAIESVMSQAKDVLLVIDDYAPQFSTTGDANAARKKAAQVIRSVGNRSARGRSKADLTQQVTRIPRCLALMTAENSLVGQGIVGRLIYVHVENGAVIPIPGMQTKDTRLSILQEKAQNGLLAQAMSIYIQYLAENWDRIAEIFPAMVDAASQFAREAGGLQNRLPDAYGVLSAGQELALRSFQEIGFISAIEADTLIQENNLVLLQVIRYQADEVASESPVVKFLSAIASLLEQRKIYLAMRTGTDSLIGQIGNAVLVGYVDQDNPKVVYLRTEMCLARAKEYWKDLDQNFDIMPDALRRQMSQVPELLYEVDKNQIEVSKSCGGSNKRVLAVNIEKVEQLYELSIRKPN